MPNYVCAHAVLKLEHVFERAVEPVRPEVVAGCCVDQLSGDANAVADFADATLKDIAHAEFAPDLPDVGELPLYAKVEFRAMTKSDLKRESPVMMSSYETIDEIFLLGVAAHILKRQHRDGRLVGKSQCWPRLAGEVGVIDAPEGAGQSSAAHSTRKARIGRSMFLRASSPRAWRETLSRPLTASRTARETIIPPGGASASSRAATFTSSP